MRENRIEGGKDVISIFTGTHRSRRELFYNPSQIPRSPDDFVDVTLFRIHVHISQQEEPIITYAEVTAAIRRAFKGKKPQCT